MTLSSYRWSALGPTTPHSLSHKEEPHSSFYISHVRARNSGSGVIGRLQPIRKLEKGLWRKVWEAAGLWRCVLVVVRKASWTWDRRGLRTSWAHRVPLCLWPDPRLWTPFCKSCQRKPCREGNSGKGSSEHYGEQRYQVDTPNPAQQP